jgi:hypothetical protein
MLHEVIINYHPEEKELGQTTLKQLLLFVSMPANIPAMRRCQCGILAEELLATDPELISCKHGYLSSEISRQKRAPVCATAIRLLIQLQNWG